MATDEDYTDDIDEQEQEHEEEQRSPKGLRRFAERAQQEAAEAKREADRAKRELALTKAGVDTDSKLGKLFAAAYDGPLEVDAVKAAYAELLPSAPSTNTPPVEEAPVPTPTPEELDAQRRTSEMRDRASSGPVNLGPDSSIGKALTVMQNGGDRGAGVKAFLTSELDRIAAQQ